MTATIDSHQHFWEVGRFDYPWMNPDVNVLCQDYLPGTLEPILKRTVVEKTVLVQASNSLAETQWLLSLADEYPFIAGVVGWLDLTSFDVAQQLDEFIAHPKFAGVRHLVESEPADDWLMQPSVMNGLQLLASRGIAYDLLVHTRHLKYASAVAERCPELRLVIDHMAKPPIAQAEIDEWTKQFRQMAGYANVYCKLSGLVTEADWSNWKLEDLKPYVQVALEYFGSQRLMFGSDWPVCLLAASYDQVLDTAQSLLGGLSSEERERVFSSNASEVYRLEAHALSA